LASLCVCRSEHWRSADLSLILQLSPFRRKRNYTARKNNKRVTQINNAWRFYGPFETFRRQLNSGNLLSYTALFVTGKQNKKFLEAKNRWIYFWHGSKCLSLNFRKYISWNKGKVVISFKSFLIMRGRGWKRGYWL
jgi:hypothetical protein